MAPKKKTHRSSDDDFIDPHRKASSSSSTRSFSSSMASRTIAYGRLVDFSFLEQEGFELGRLLDLQGWSDLLKTKKPIYPDLVKEFYENMTLGEYIISSSVKKTKIEFDGKILGSILNIPAVEPLENHPGDRKFRLASILEIDVVEAEKIDALDANKFCAENRLLHSMIAKIFVPRAGSFNAVTDRDISVMYHIINEHTFDLPDLMITVIKEALGRSKAALPYGMFLTYVFEFFNVKLKGEHSVELRHTDIFNAHSLHRMDFAKQNGTWIKSRSRVGDKPGRSLPPTDPSHQIYSSPIMDFNFDFPEPQNYMSAPLPFIPTSADQQQPFMSSGPDPCYTNPSASRPSVEISEEQIQRIIREISSALSSRCSGDSGSSSNDRTVMPHISSVFETMSEINLLLKQLTHNVQILNGRVFHHNEAVMEHILKEIKQLKNKLECFEDKAEWVAFQMRATETQTRDASNAVDHWTASMLRVVTSLEQHIATFQNAPAAAPVNEPSYSHPHLHMPPPHSHRFRPAAPTRRKGSSSNTTNVSSDDD